MIPGRPGHHEHRDRFSAGVQQQLCQLAAGFAGGHYIVNQ